MASKVSRAHQFISSTSTVATAWALVYFNVLSVPPEAKAAIDIFPLWAIVAFGSYMLFKLGWDVFSFNDRKDAYDELVGEIQEAKADLRAKGCSI
ncbi:hypothetical protein CANCADRAFT_27990 [Tortispora caseinolytica NRRL Y-17796]|uniref:Dolichol-phosphate mannosyltransferase subunit 3 n=1 Tax=Tortispora caseinolytica NRRL Y-17796 TaxID=767744 RepID=A0A1E4TA82_9ASCO|nr:hypothetical protein CANCADRAFT_27990 [Tortispora caseinolytica NRRL Y-17796]